VFQQHEFIVLLNQQVGDKTEDSLSVCDSIFSEDTFLIPPFKTTTKRETPL
jgi:hypothetical protein